MQDLGSSRSRWSQRAPANGCRQNTGVHKIRDIRMLYTQAHGTYLSLSFSGFDKSISATIHTVSESKQNGSSPRFDAVKEGCKRIQTIPYPSYIKRYTTMLSWEFPDKTFLPPHVYPFWHTAQAGSLPRDWDQGRLQLPFVRMRLSAFEWSPLDWQGVRIAQTHSERE